MRTIRWASICPHGESLHIARLGAVRSPHWRRHDHDFFECFFVEAGEALHAPDGEESVVGRGDVVFVRPEHAHGLQARGGALQLTNVALETSVVEGAVGRHSGLRELWPQGRPPRVLRLARSQWRTFTALVADLSAGGRQALDAEYFLLSVARILAAPAAQASAEMPSWLVDVLPEADQPDFIRLGVAGIYRQCGRSPEHVSRTFRQHMGCTPTAWLNAARIRLARRLLETSSLSVLEVALECGFESPSHFHRLFSAATKSTPLAYRRRAHGIQSG